MHDSDSGLNHKMAHFCIKCKSAIINKQFLVCRVCEKYYHLDCTDVSFQRFRLMTAVNKKTFRCEPCLSKREVQMLDPTTSPLLPITKITKNITRNLESTLDSNASLPIPIDSSTQKPTHTENYIVNIPTENSFQDLYDENEESITSTPIQNNYLNLRTRKIYLEELKEKIYRLEKKLETAENNIEKLTERNETLEKQIANYCKTILRNKSDPKNQKVQIEKNATKSPTNNHQIEIQANPTSEPNNEKTVDPQKTLQEGATNSKNKSKNIYILGDEHLRTLSSALLRTRLGRWNDDYQPDAVIMPGATSTELLNQCEKLSNKIKTGDVVVLGFGNNDKDLHIFHSNLCIALNKLCKVTVLIAPIIKNLYLNENTLNYHLKLWTKHFGNCTVIEFNLIKNSRYIKYVCNKINICIDYYKYKTDFLNFDCIKKHNVNKKSVDDSIQIEKTEKETTTPKKGTIPYFFRRATTTPTAVLLPNNTPQCTNVSSIIDPHQTIKTNTSPIQPHDTNNNQTIPTNSSIQQHITNNNQTILTNSSPIQQHNTNKTKTFFRP